VSVLAWDILNEGIDDVITVDDKAAEDCMRLLAGGCDDDPPIVAGESAVAGLAGLIGALQQPDLRVRLQLNTDSRILLFGTEGATDPVLYRQIVGYGPADVLAGKISTARQQHEAEAKAAEDTTGAADAAADSDTAAAANADEVSDQDSADIHPQAGDSAPAETDDSAPAETDDPADGTTSNNNASNNNASDNL
jgi:hypothetical protein